MRGVNTQPSRPPRGSDSWRRRGVARLPTVTPESQNAPSRFKGGRTVSPEARSGQKLPIALRSPWERAPKLPSLPVTRASFPERTLLWIFGPPNPVYSWVVDTEKKSEEAGKNF